MARAVLVTGAGDSVGRVIAEMFLARGAKVHIADIRPNVTLATLAANPGMSGTIADVADRAAVARLFDDVRDHLPGLDALVNCVGIGGPRAMTESIADEDWRATFDVNVHGVFATMQHAIPMMREAGHGAIVNFSTGSTRTRLPSRSAYVASKFALEGLTLNAARELGPAGIRCNAILPGIIDNARMRGIMAQRAAEEGTTLDVIEEDYLRFVSMRSMIQPAEIAEMVVFLCSDAAKLVTGELIAVSGNLEWEA